MYERSRQYLSFNIAGFSHWYGAEQLGKLKAGTKLKLESEPDNPYDPNAVAIYFKDVKIGYVPRRMNGELSQLMYFGYEKIFKTVVTQVDPEADPENQVHATIFIRDAR